MVELRVAQGDAGLVGQDRGDLPLGLAREVGGRRLEEEHAEHSLLVLQRQVEPASHLVRHQVLPEDGDEEPLRVGRRILAVGEVEGLTPSRRPLRAGDEVAEPGVVGVHLLLPRHGPDVARALLVKPHGAAIEGEGPRCEVDHRLEHPVDVEGGGDLAADLEQDGEVARPALGAVQLRVPQRAGRGRRESLQQLPVVGVEDTGAGPLVHHLDGADRHPSGHHWRRHDGAGDGVLGGVGGLLEPRVARGLHDHGGPLLLRHIAHESGSDWHLGAHQPGGRASKGQPAVKHVALGDPQRPSGGAHGRQDPVEDPRKQLVEIEGCVELEGDRVEEPEPLDFQAQLLQRGWRYA